MIPRDRYLNQLIAFQDKNLIKVVTGMRRVGKSTILELMADHLRKQGVPDERIIFFKMESMEFDGISYKEFYEIVLSRTKEIDRPYLFFDELQGIEGWERAVNSLRVDLDCDIYITGSNAFLLSSEISTLLSGRYVEIEMYPLTFAEYLEFRGARWHPAESKLADIVSFEDGSFATVEKMMEQYRQYGGLPFLALSDPDREVHKAYCKALYDTVMIRDVIQRNKRQDRRALTNPDLLKRVCRFLADNVGNENSVNSIASALRSSGGKAANDTVDAYISALREAYLFCHADRFDIKGRELLKNGGKHYISDVGIRNYLQGYRDSDQGRVFENIVYLQLLYEGYEVSVGKLRVGEVDFVAMRGSERVYIQVTEDMTDPSTMERELRPLKAIRDAYPKQVVTMRGSYPSDIDGIQIVSAANFLLRR